MDHCRAGTFGGGGTSFEAAGETLRPRRGEMLSHFGRVRHAGEPTTAGTRYVLVGFVRARPLAAAWREVAKEEAPPDEEDEDEDEEAGRDSPS